VVDCVGGDALARGVASLRYGAAVATPGNTGGTALATSVFPFVLRGVALLGIDFVPGPGSRSSAGRRSGGGGTLCRSPRLDELATDEVTLGVYQ
jgi:acrylyl-CoA reductase (NADPH)